MGKSIHGDNLPATNRRLLAKWRQYSATMSACLGSFISGAIASWTSPAYEPVVEQGSLGFPVSDVEFSYVGSIMPVGAILICCVTGFLVDRFGCKNFLLSMVIPYTISWSLIIWPANINMVYLGRLIAGVGCGSFCAILPVYITEIAEKDIRGALSSFYTLFFIGGIFYGYLVGAMVSLKTLSQSYLVISLIFGAWLFFQPESPVFYVRRGQLERAREILLYFRGHGYDVQTEFQEIEERETKRKLRSSFSENFKRRSVQRAVTICFVLQVFQQLTGIETLFFFQKWILEQSTSVFSADVGTIIIGGMHLIFTLASTIFVDNLGRKMLLLISASIVGLSCFTLSIFYSLDTDVSSQYSFVPVIALTTFRSVYALGFGPIPWVIVGEILSEEVKNSLAPATAIVGWAMVVTTTFTFPYVVSYFGMGPTFLCFGIGAFLGVVFTAFYVPETKRKTLDEIQAIFEDGHAKKKFKLPGL